jgi:hypothetical protein
MACEVEVYGIDISSGYVIINSTKIRII